MARNVTSRVPFRRRREGKTNYKKRLALLKSGKPRVVVRKTNSKMIIQIIEYHPDGDTIPVAAVSTKLKKYGWNHSVKNIPASYLTGLLAGKQAVDNGIDEAVLDIGIRVPVKGGNIFAALKGLIDSGVDVPHGEGIFPSEDILKGKGAGIDLSSDLEKVKGKILGNG